MKELHSDTTKLYDLSKLEEMSRGNPAFVKRLITTFISETETSLEILKAHIKNQNYIGIQALAHKLEPSTSMMGLNLMNDLKKLKKHGQSQDKIEKIQTLFLSIDFTCKAAISQLKNCN